MKTVIYNHGNYSAVDNDATTRHTQETYRGGSAADCTKKSADVAQVVSKRSSATRKVNPHATVRKARRERYSRYLAALEAVRESLFEAEECRIPGELLDCVSPSVTREDRLFISRECGVTSVDDGEGWFAYQQRTLRPRVLSHEGAAAVLFAQAEAEQKRRAEARNRELGYGKSLSRSRGGK